MADKPQPINLRVLATQRLTPNMHRLTIGGDALANFPSGQQGGYIKLFLDAAAPSAKQILRTFTIRDQRAGELDVDFTLHGDHAAGPATGWAIEAKVGDPITIRGPGAAKPLPAGFDTYLVAGDMSALPAISANLEAMHRDAKGVVALEIQDEADRIAIDAPRGMEIRWLINPQPGSQPQLLAESLRSVPLDGGSIYGWAASEFGAMCNLRGFLREELGLGPRELYISSYWKLGLNETEHKVVKREDAETQPA